MESRQKRQELPTASPTTLTLCCVLLTTYYLLLSTGESALPLLLSRLLHRFARDVLNGYRLPREPGATGTPYYCLLATDTCCLLLAIDQLLHVVTNY